MAEAPMTVGDALVVLDPAGALWLPDSRTLVVADLHLEKSSSFARHGMLLPPYDTGATLLLLAGLVARREPRRVICLGDSFHDRGGFGRLSATDCAALIALQSGRDWVWITGNHDPELPCDSGGDVQAELRSDGLTFRHEPVAGMAAGEIAGHLHPSAKIRGRGRSGAAARLRHGWRSAWCCRPSACWPAASTSSTAPSPHSSPRARSARC
jgi:DNA ligase-associated metallophosphoesterase